MLCCGCVLSGVETGRGRLGAVLSLAQVQVLAPAPALASGQARGRGCCSACCLLGRLRLARWSPSAAASTVLALASLASSPCFHNWSFASMFFLSSFASFPTTSNWIFSFLRSLCSFGCGLWLVLIYYEKKVLLAGWWWLVLIWCKRKALLAD